MNFLQNLVFLNCLATVLQPTAASDTSDSYIVVTKQNGIVSSTFASLEVSKAAVKDKFGFIPSVVTKLGSRDVYGATLNQEQVEELKMHNDIEIVEKNGRIHKPRPVETRQGFVLKSASPISPASASQSQFSSNGSCIEAVYDIDGLWGQHRIAQRDTLDLSELAVFRYSYADDEQGTGVYVYVMDSGIDVAHAEFEGRAVWGFTASSIEEGNQDLDGHGTHVAGTVGGVNVGVAKNVTLVSVKILGSDGEGSTLNVLQGINFIRQDSIRRQGESGDGKSGNKSIVNMSFGADEDSVVITKAINEAVEQDGIIFVAAAGNEATDACSTFPANLNHVISVGATNHLDELAGFSNYGACVDIMAPGYNIYSSRADPESPSPSGYVLSSGTSAATPHVSGTIARYLSNQVGDTDCIKTFLCNTATKGKLRIPSRADLTPNHLLYAPCHTGFVGNSSQCETECQTYIFPGYHDGSTRLKTLENWFLVFVVLTPTMYNLQIFAWQCLYIRLMFGEVY